MSKARKSAVKGDGGRSGRSDTCEAGEVGRLVDCSQADDRRMIGLVRVRSLLYARSNMPVASYYTRVKQLWQEVADEMQWTVAEVRRKWSHIRNSYSRHLRNELHGARTGRGRVVSRWYLADELDFLKEHMATDTRSSPYSTYAPSFLRLNLEEEHQPEDADVKPFLTSPWLSALHTAPSPAPSPAPSTAAVHAAHAAHAAPRTLFTHLADDSSSSQFGPDENSSFFQFFRGIYNDYQELTARKQRQFKRQCLNFLHELLDEEEREEEEEGRGSGGEVAVNLSYESASGAEEEREQKPTLHAAEVILPTDTPLLSLHPLHPLHPLQH